MKVHETLKKYILVDGFPYVADLVNSSGSWFADALTGDRLLDCYSMHASQPLGWNHPRLTGEYKLEGIAHHNVSNSDLYTREYAAFVESFAKLTPDFKNYFFVSGGTLAVENALKAAFDWKAQLLDKEVHDDCLDLDVIHLREAFHGRSGYTLSLTNTGLTKTKFFPKFKWTRVINPKIEFPVNEENIQIVEEISLSHIKQTLEKGKVAAVILEPIQGEGGDNHFRKEYFRQLRLLTLEYGAMLIFDEIQTGLGMTGKMWCYEHFDVIPDMLVFGKKTQVCGFCSTSRIHMVDKNVFTESGRINSTWGGNLVDMVRATAIFEIIEEDNLVSNAAEVGDYFLDELRRKVPDIKNARGRGLMIAFDLDSEDDRDDFYETFSKKVLFLKCGQRSVRFRPHLTFSKQDVDQMIEFLKPKAHFNDCY